MGIFSKLFRMFSKNIECGEEIDSHLVFLYPAKKVYVNSNIVIRPNFNVVFVVKDKITDVLYPGKFKIGQTLIPETFKRLRLDKPNRRGRVPTSFKADVYFVNTGIFREMTFFSNVAFYIRNTPFGKVKGYPEGVFDCKVVEPSSLIKFLLIERAYIKSGVAAQVVKTTVGNVVSEQIENCGIPFERLLEDIYAINSKISDMMFDKFSGLGLSISNVAIQSMSLPNKTQQKIEEYFQKNRGQSVSQLNMVQENTSTDYSLPDTKVALYKGIEALQNKKMSRRIKETSNINVEPDTNVDTEKLLAKLDKKTCVNCGAEMDISYQFCPNCGQRQ